MISAENQIHSIQRALDELAPFQQNQQPETQSTAKVKEALNCLETALGLLTKPESPGQFQAVPKSKNEHRLGYPWDDLE